MTLKTRLQDDMKTALKSKDKDRLGTIRLILAAIKQREVDERIDLDDAAIITVLDRMAKQRRESISQFQNAGRTDLADKEEFELAVIQSYLPAALSDAELDQLIEAAMTESGASSIRDMGKVMALIKPKAQGRADMTALSARVKARLGATG
ncbi:MAG: GatB/YqeY domain-containing protein [Gammaproteobacteria bacterium]